jgi:hypothetical protein
MEFHAPVDLLPDLVVQTIHHQPVFDVDAPDDEDIVLRLLDLSGDVRNEAAVVRWYLARLQRASQSAG